MPTVQAFSLTTPDKTLRLSQPRAEFPVTVKNEGTVADRVDLEVEALNAGGAAPADPAWFTVDGKPLPVLRPVAAGASETFTVVLTLPSPPPANGSYGFRPIAYSAVRSHQETLTRGPDMTAVLALPVVVPVPWWKRWWWAIALAVLAVVAVVVVVVVLAGRDPDPPPAVVFPAGGEALSTEVQTAIGGSFDARDQRIVVAEFGGRVAAVDVRERTTSTLGTGYQLLEDVEVLPDGTLLVTERTGNLLRLPGTGASRGEATLLAAGMVEPQQMALTADGRQLFVVEFSPAGRLLRFDIAGTSVTGPVQVAAGLQQPIGVAVDAAGTRAYVTEQATRSLVELDLRTGTRRVLTNRLQSAFFLEWTSAGRTALLVAERAPVNAVVRYDLASGLLQEVVVGAPAIPSSVVSIGGANVAVLADREVRAYTLS